MSAASDMFVAATLPPRPLAPSRDAIPLPFAPSVRRTVWSAAIALALAGGALAWWHPTIAPAGAPIARLGAGAAWPRRWRARLSVPSADAPCAGTLSLETLACAGAAPPSDSSIAAAIGALRGGGDVDSPAMLHATAIVDLAFASGDGATRTVDRSIETLIESVRLDSSGASGWVDLAAAYLARAHTRDSRRDLFQSLDAALHALDLSPRSPAARYDAAIALDLLGLTDRALQMWQSVVDLEPNTAWGSEAKQRLANTTSSIRAATTIPLDVANDSLVALATRAPAETRPFVLERLLGDWAAAERTGDMERARTRLATATIAAHTQAAVHGDSSLFVVVRDIASRPIGSPARRALADAHERYARAQSAARTDAPSVADSGFIATMRLARGTSLAQWARLGHANSVIQQRRPDEAERILDSLARGAMPALEARVRWNLSVLRLRRGLQTSGLADLERARASYASVGERENVAATRALEGEARFVAGQTVEGFELVGRALDELRDEPASLWRHNVLFVAAKAARNNGMTRAAAAIEDEDNVAADAAGRSVTVAESRLARARALWGGARTAAATEALGAAERTILALPAGPAKAQMTQELNVTLASGSKAAQPAVARSLADSAIGFFRQLHNPVKLIPAYLARSRASLALGDVAGAERDLDSATALYDPSRREIADIPQKAALSAQARSIAEQLTMLRLQTDGPAAALSAFEKSRAVFASIARRDARDAGGISPVQHTVIDLGFVGDTLLTWIARGPSLRVERRTVSYERIVRLVERARWALATQGTDAAVQAPLGELYDLIVRPIEDKLPSGDPRLTIVADGPLAAIPFAALRDRRTGRYLVESRLIAVSGSFAGALGEAPRGASTLKALVVRPTSDPSRIGGRLRSAAGEAAAIARVYPGARLAEGAAADSAQVASALADAEVLHFAGHAVFDDVQPARSTLVLPPRSLDATAIARLDLRRLRIAVLSACETSRSASSPASGISGLAQAFLAAGAGGVLGTLWEVDDEHAAALTTAFHREYAAGRDPADALRRAQLALLHDSSPLVRSPSAWGAFQYTGR